MTLIVGLFCSDGLLFCSDTEETGGHKSSVEKLYESYGSDWSMVVATAGHSALGDVAVSRLRGAAKNADDSFARSHEQVIVETLSNIYEKHVWPREQSIREDREFTLIIGVQDRGNGNFYLYKTCDEILQPKDNYASAGNGESVADYFLERFYDRSLTESESKEFMAFVMREAKDSAGYVGRETEMVALRGQGPISKLIYGRSMEATIPHLSHCMNKFWKKS